MPVAGDVVVCADRDALLGAVLEENRQLRAELAVRDARLEQASADLASAVAKIQDLSAQMATLQRMVFGRSSERGETGQPGGKPGSGGGDGGRPAGGRRRGKSGNRRRDYSHLPRVEVSWDFEDGCAPSCRECGKLFSALGDDASEQIDWQVLLRLIVRRRRRYRRACRCEGPVTVTAPGPPKATGKGLFSNAFIARLLAERYVSGRSQHSITAGLARDGAEISDATLCGTVQAAGALLAPLEDAITARSRDSWHLHADETTWHVFTPAGGDGPARWWLWVFLGADTVCFVMDPTRAAGVLARHAGIDQATGQLVADADGGPRRLVISSDFYSVYASAGKKADGLASLFCWAHIRRYFVRAGDANPDQLSYWRQGWLERIKNLYAAHGQLMAAFAAGQPLDDAQQAWDKAIGVIDADRKKQAAVPGLQEPAKKTLATLNREWDGLKAHRDYPMIGLDNNPGERAIRRPVVTRKNAYGSRTDEAARAAARLWTVTGTAELAGLSVITYLTAYLDACGRNHGKPLHGPGLDRFLPWKATPADLQAWAKPPPPG
ncbi:MAG: IS66 family transposase [Streptosporangiaceae bacterium]